MEWSQWLGWLGWEPVWLKEGEEPVAMIQGQSIKGSGSCHSKRKDFHTL